MITNDQIQNEPAGEQMDRWVAEYIMGWELKDWLGGEFAVHSTKKGPVIKAWLLKDSDKPGHWFWMNSEKNLPYFSTEIADAWQVVKKMQGMGFSYVIYGACFVSSVMSGNVCIFRKDIWPPEKGTKEGNFMGHAHSLSLAICRAALFATLWLMTSERIGTAASYTDLQDWAEEIRRQRILFRRY